MAAFILVAQTLAKHAPSSIISLKTPLISCHEIEAMSKMFVLFGIVMLRAAAAARANGWPSRPSWLSKSPYHSREGEQIAYEPSSDEIRDFQDALQSLESPMSATKEQARVIIPRLRNMEKFRDVKHWTMFATPYLVGYAKLFMPLNVRASAVSFCSELMKEANTERLPRDFLESQLQGARDICPKVLTGSLKPADGRWRWRRRRPKNWEVEAAKVSQIHGEKHEFGRLDKVAWRSSLHRVCTDECNALVEEMENQTSQLAHATMNMMLGAEGDSVEEVCADTVVKKVEAEILTCCATSCGWNGRSCTYWPLMSPKEQNDWQGECCTEMNILQNSTREKLCDSTLTEHETEESRQIIDNRDNTPEDRAILGQDRGGSSNAWSFLEKHPTYDADNCPSPLDLAKRHKKWATDWKRMDDEKLKGAKRDKCQREQQDTIEGCKIFLIVATNPSNNEKQKKYVYTCLDACKFKAPDQEALKPLTTESGLSPNGWVYVHKEIYMTNWTLT